VARFFPSGVSVGGQSRCFSQISMIKDTHHQFYTAACKPDRARRHPLCWICLWFTSPMIPKVFLLLIVICFIHRHLQTLIRSVLTVTLSPDVLLPIRGACGSFLHRLHYNLPSHCRCFRHVLSSFLDCVSSGVSLLLTKDFANMPCCCSCPRPSPFSR